jgi:hypothetical protein
MEKSLSEDYFGSVSLNFLYQMRSQLFPLLSVIRAPGGVGTLRTMTSTSPVPFTTFTEENIHTQGSLDTKFELIQPTGIASLLHFVWSNNLDNELSPTYL